MITKSKIDQYVMCFRKPWLSVKSVNFDFSAKLSSYDYNESNKPNSKSLAHVGFEKSLVEFEFQKMSFFFFTFFSRLKGLLFTPSHSWCKNQQVLIMTS